MRDKLLFFIMFACVLASTPACTDSSSPGASDKTTVANNRSEQPQANGVTADDKKLEGLNKEKQSGGASQGGGQGEDEGVGDGSGLPQTGSSLVGAPNPQGNPAEVLYHSEPKWLYLSEVQNGFTKPVDFSCPGDSVLSGEKSAFDTVENSDDRKYQFYCQFMTDGQGVGLRKSNCELSNIFKGEDISYTCPAGKFMSGQKSWYHSDSRDRDYQYECCDLLTQNEKKVQVNTAELEDGAAIELCSNDDQRIQAQLKNFPQYAPMVNVDVNTRFGEVDYSCSGTALLPLGGLTVNFEPIPIANAVLRRVKTRLNTDSNDRTHSFYCCQLKVE